MPYKCITLEYMDKVAVLTFNQPDVLNALSFTMMTEVAAALNKIERSDARCLLLAGAGKSFCSGANLAETDMSRTMGEVLETFYNPVLTKIKNMSIPMVSAVNGGAAGVGMSFAIIADIVVAEKDAYFLQSFSNIGLVPDGGSTWMLPRLVGWSRALELSLLAERLPAEKAMEWGLVNRVVDNEDLMSEAMAIATKLANGPKSLGLTRKLYWQSLDNSFAEQLQLEADTQVQASRTKDCMEGVMSFLEKREANFRGK